MCGVFVSTSKCFKEKINCAFLKYFFDLLKVIQWEVH